MASLKTVLKDKSSKRFLLFAGVAVSAAVAFAFLGGQQDSYAPSNLGSVPYASGTAQGGSAINPAYDEALSVADQQRIEEAREGGASAIRTIRAETSEVQLPDRLPDGLEDEFDDEDEEPVVRRPGGEVVEPDEIEPRIEPAPVIARPIITRPAEPRAEPRPTVSQNQAEDPIYQAMLAEMSRLHGERRIPPQPATIQMINDPVAFAERDASAQAAAQVPSAQAPVNFGGLQETGEGGPEVKLPLAGTVLYAEMVSRANSDAPGPVLARILEGPYTGSTLIGSFQVAESSLVISFDRMTVTRTRNGEEINRTVPIEAVAVDTQYIGTALATSVDRHLFQKIAIGFVTSFIDGFGSAIAQQGTSVTERTDGSTITSRPELNTREQVFVAAGEAAGTTGNILMDEFGNRPTTVIVDQGTSIGVLFL